MSSFHEKLAECMYPVLYDKSSPSFKYRNKTNLSCGDVAAAISFRDGWRTPLVTELKVNKLRSLKVTSL